MALARTVLMFSNVCTDLQRRRLPSLLHSNSSAEALALQGKNLSFPKGNEAVPLSETKKKVAKSNDTVSKRANSVLKPREGISVNLGTVLGLQASILGSLSLAEKIIGRVILPSDKEKVDKLTLDQVVTRFFHAIGQQAVVLGSSLEIQSREARDEVTLQQGQVDSLEGEMLAKSEILVAELRQRVAHSKKLAMEDFKSLDFQDAVETTASKYFGEGFDFCKWQLHRHHPDLVIDLEGMGLNHDLLEEEEIEEK
ncbi:hypothetical protein Acr_22g0002240 [Actinidia rufa]|uniref:Uncharacterized protein n=1 Tax=Actinidia rufa TaxID=165716 RepID=A0A7J0GJ38_9ERIC|nr:hypothetical protein Acr_22g0002240 [Actinidia rufa]